MSRSNSTATLRTGDEVYTVTTIYFNKTGNFGDNMETEVFSNEEQAREYMRCHAQEYYINYHNNNHPAAEEQGGEEEDEGEDEGAENEEASIYYDEINEDTFHQELHNNQSSNAGDNFACYCNNTWTLYKLTKVKISDGRTSRGGCY